MVEGVQQGPVLVGTFFRGWGSTTPSRAPRRPTSNYSPHRATSSRCAPPNYDTATRAA